MFSHNRYGILTGSTSKRPASANLHPPASHGQNSIYTAYSSPLVRILYDPDVHIAILDRVLSRFPHEKCLGFGLSPAPPGSEAQGLVEKRSQLTGAQGAHRNTGSDSNFSPIDWSVGANIPAVTFIARRRLAVRFQGPTTMALQRWEYTCRL